MCNEKNSDDNQLKNINPVSYYLKNFNNPEIQEELKELSWSDPYLYEHIIRLNYINQISNHQNIHQCPECENNIITNEWGEEYCETCGLVTRTNYNYVAGQKINLPFGLK